MYTRSLTHLLAHSTYLGMNFTHRIDRFSYADEEIGAQTLDGDVKIAYDGVCVYLLVCVCVCVCVFINKFFFDCLY